MPCADPLSLSSNLNQPEGNDYQNHNFAVISPPWSMRDDEQWSCLGSNGESVFSHDEVVNALYVGLMGYETDRGIIGLPI